ncbi:MAG: ParB/RepB/Spo0J family partition protein [Bdellovibrionaceae bacterium]|nr:ParB/RepB/Spo0J family partition protein [Pseudobdellovibrionaceae bacterium]
MANKNTEQSTDTKNNKKRLGRGLGSLLGVGGASLDETEELVSDTSEKKQASKEPPKVKSATEAPKVEVPDTERIHWVAVENLEANKYQPRKVFNPQPLEDLAASIKEKGIMQPIVAQRLSANRFEIIAGERRWRAAQKAGLVKVPVILKETNEKDSLELALIENIQRDDLNPIEEALAYQILVDKHNMTQADVAEKVGKDRATVTNTLRLLKLSREVQDMVAAGDLSMGHARCLVVVEDKELQKKLAKKCLDLSLSVRSTEKLVKTTLEGKPSDVEVETSETRALQALSKEIQRNTGAKTKIQYKNGRGQLTLQFYNKEQFEGLIKKFREWN